MISSVHIDNFKSIKELALDMTPVNLLIGSNGAGKSNFLSFFRLLKSMYDGKLQQYVAEEGSAEDLLYFGSKNSAFVSGQIQFSILTQKNNSYFFDLIPDSEGGFYFDKEIISFQDNTLSEKKQEILFGEGYRESKIRAGSGNTVKNITDYLDSFRVFHFQDTGKTSRMRKPALLNDNLFLREDGSNLPAILYYIQEKYPKELKRIEMVVRSVAPYFDRFNLNPDRINEEQIRLEWLEKGTDSYFNARHLSDGTLRFIALATLLLQPLAPKVIIIDEPELGLHPFAIDKLAGLVKKASVNTQIILSTQSVNLLNNFTPEDVVTVDQCENQSVFKRHNSSELAEWLKGYTISDLWNKNVIGGRP